MSEDREMFEPINALVGGLAKAFAVETAEIVRALEAEELALRMETDAEGKNYVEARLKDRIAFIYPGSLGEQIKKSPVPHSGT